MTISRLLSFGVALSTVSACVGCGGHFEASSPTPARGLYAGPMSNERLLNLLVMGDGTYWGIYSTEANDSLVAGLIQGQGRTSGTGFTSLNGRDFNLEGLGIQNFTLSATFEEMMSIGGTARYSPSSFVTFMSAYDDDFELTPALAPISGNYTGSFASSSGTGSATLSINAAGAITGSGASGCTFGGTISPRSDGNVFDVSIRFSGGACASGLTITTGVGVYDATNKQLTTAVLNGGRTDGAVFVGTKP